MDIIVCITRELGLISTNPQGNMNIEIITLVCHSLNILLKDKTVPIESST